MSSGTLTLWARLLFGTLAKAGVRDVVVSPGSRSTPFAVAALTHSELSCHSIWDERSAGFFALGQARLNGRPSLLLCTSGSAAAQYFPAIVEAAASFTPLLVLTADRPFELQECGAAQTMDQVKLYGGFVRRFLELGHPDSSAAALDGLERLALQAVAASRAPLPGPVHLNAKARKPLEPQGPESAAEHAASEQIQSRLARPIAKIYAPEPRVPEQAIVELARACRATPRGLIVAGPVSATRAVDAEALHELACVTGYPLCVEATSQARFCDPGQADASSTVVVGALDALFRSRHRARLVPELVLSFGAPATSSAFEQWLSDAQVDRSVITAHGYLDPQSRAQRLVPCDPFVFARALSRAVLEQPERPNAQAERERFRAQYRRLNARYFEFVAELADAAPRGTLSEPSAVRRALASLPRGAVLGLGNSLPVRDVDQFVPPAPKALQVWSQRGLNGIDGLVSGAIGAAQAARVPSLMLLGDVSFLHDVGGLAAARDLGCPLALLVIDNNGGRIFAELPLAKALKNDPNFERFWLTPPGLDLAHAAALYRVAYLEASHAAALDEALQRAFSHNGLTLIHARVDPDSARSLNAALLERLDTESDARAVPQ